MKRRPRLTVLQSGKRAPSRPRVKTRKPGKVRVVPRSGLVLVAALAAVAVVVARPDWRRSGADLIPPGLFAGLPLLARAELAEALDPGHVPGGDFLLRVRATERNLRDFPSLGQPAAADVDLAELLAAAE